ncbi:hypothetical protein LINPERHAP1_LOCUS29730 [Linum perenne]
MPDAVTKPYSAFPLMSSIVKCLMPSRDIHNIWSDQPLMPSCGIINTSPRELELMLMIMIVADQDLDANPSIASEPMQGTKTRPPPESDPRKNDRPSVMRDTKEDAKDIQTRNHNQVRISQFWTDS